MATSLSILVEKVNQLEKQNIRLVLHKSTVKRSEVTRSPKGNVASMRVGGVCGGGEVRQDGTRWFTLF